MHRTEGDDYVLEGSLRRFHDQELPTYNGTVDTAEYNNAVQEELCYIIEATGTIVADGAVTDRADGWHQVYDAIFTQGNIDSDSIGSLILDRLVDGELNITRGAYNISANPTELSMNSGALSATLTFNALALAAAGGAENTVSPGGVTTRFAGNVGFLSSDTVGLQTDPGQYEYKLITFVDGVTYFGAAHPNEFPNTRWNKARIDLDGSGAGWAISASGHLPWTTDRAIETGIPTSCDILSGSMQYIDDTATLRAAPVLLSPEDPLATGTWKVFISVFGRDETATFKPQTNNSILEISFDGLNLRT